MSAVCCPHNLGQSTVGTFDDEGNKTMMTYPVTFVLGSGEGSELAAVLAIWQRQVDQCGAIDMGGCAWKLSLSVDWHDYDNPRSDEFVQSYLAVFCDALGEDAASSLTSDAGSSA
ncbi:MAG: hypothetical protein CFE31_00525 [Rhizobiales bacterium PAR1]|nr:MAG: hypothetical protein CFE31_00525 [Rhizobiales bacterium PAR1]